MRGTWGVAGTDPEHVERMVRDMSGMLAGEVPRGMGGWLGLAGRLLGGALGGAAAVGDEEGDDRHHRHDGADQGRGMVGYGGNGSEVSRDGRGKGRRMVDDHEYHDHLVDEDEVRDDMRRRRRRRRREVD